MSQEVYEIIRRLDPKQLETQLVMQCAPLIAGLKVANLLIIPCELTKQVKRILGNSNISFYVLGKTDRKTVLFLYDAKALSAYLLEESVMAYMASYGYENTDLKGLLYMIRKQYLAFLKNQTDFPHILGVMLGYPIEDVEGYIVNKGQNALCTGYWKVYENPKEKIGLFRRFELARAIMAQLLSQGTDISDILMKRVCLNI